MNIILGMSLAHRKNAIDFDEGGKVIWGYYRSNGIYHEIFCHTISQDEHERGTSYLVKT